MSARAITKSLTGITTDGTALDVTGIPVGIPAVLMIHPGRTGDIRLQWASGALADGGAFIPILEGAGGDDALVLRADGVERLPKFVASETGVAAVKYTVAISLELIHF